MRIVTAVSQVCVQSPQAVQPAASARTSKASARKPQPSNALAANKKAAQIFQAEHQGRTHLVQASRATDAQRTDLETPIGTGARDTAKCHSPGQSCHCCCAVLRPMCFQVAFVLVQISDPH